MNMFKGYVAMEDGFTTEPVHLEEAEDAVRYVHLQMKFQYRVFVTDETDSIVIEAIQGKLVFPTPEQLNI